MRRPPPRAPLPDLQRRPDGAFGWLPASLLHEGWLARLGPQATTVLLLLALAADARGASYYSRDRMAQKLRLNRHEVDQALEHLLDLHLVAFRPWREGQCDGVWQLLPVPRSPGTPRMERTVPLSKILDSLGWALEGDPSRGKDAQTAE